MPTTPNFLWFYPAGSDRPTLDKWIGDLAKAVDTTLSTINNKIVPKTGGAFTGKVQVPNGTGATDAVNKSQLDTKAEFSKTPRPATWTEGAGRAIVVRGNALASPTDPGNTMSTIWLPLPVGDSRHPGVIRFAVDNIDYGVMAIVSPSDPSLKEPITGARSTPNYVGFFQDLSPSTFRFKDNDEVGARWGGTEHVGFMADAVKAARDKNNIPLGVAETDESGRAVGVNTDDLLAILWAVVKEQQARIEALESK